MFLGYPIIGTAEGKYTIDAIWLTPRKGIVIFDLVEGRALGDYQQRQDEAANLLEAKLRVHQELVRRRDLLIPIHTVTFAPAVARINEVKSDDGDCLISDSKRLDKIIQDIEPWNEPDEIFKKALSAIQSISTIRKGRIKRKPEKQDSRGAKLKRLEDSIATLDAQQARGVVETVKGIQRIRGLAGSGKTIVLALKAAYLHAQHPEWRIAVTFNTRSLKGQFHRLINTFCIEQTGEEPDWENIRIVNAWGAPGGETRDGIYHEFCRTHAIPYYDYQSARNRFGRRMAFAGICQTAIQEAETPTPRYDAILVDEAQDFPPDFLRLCYHFLSQDKRLVYAYDELQNLGGESLPAPETIFGKNPDGSPRVQLGPQKAGEPRKDILLERCYRNSRPVLVTAHALGFGIYRKPTQKTETGLVQMFDRAKLWEEVGYRVKEGRLEEGCDVVLERTDKTSPTFLEDHSPTTDLVQFHGFDSEAEQAKWVADAIQKNIDKDELHHEDILVISLDPISPREKAGPIRKILYERRINSYLAGFDTDPDASFRTPNDSIAFSGIYCAKAHEAGMVYITDAQNCESSVLNLAKNRNRLLTAITRSKAWVRVLGIGEAMESLAEEFRQIQKADYKMRFRYPRQEKQGKMRIIYRDISQKQLLDMSENREELVEFLRDLREEKDLDDFHREQLKKVEELLLVEEMDHGSS